MKYTHNLFFFILIFAFACDTNSPNINSKGEDELSARKTDNPIAQSEIEFDAIYYVPIYSDIYVGDNHPKELLAATLSLRNTSLSDTLFVSKIDYYNTEGGLVRSFIDHQIAIFPMATVHYVIDRDDDSGGAGANFIVEIHARSLEVNPLVQAVMIGEYSNKAFAFESDGYIISQNDLN